jgi:hypothetical protein
VRVVSWVYDHEEQGKGVTPRAFPVRMRMLLISGRVTSLALGQHQIYKSGAARQIWLMIEQQNGWASCGNFVLFSKDGVYAIYI